MKNKLPYFNSPSMPSFRIFDDEDDMGNFIEDPKLRRPIGPVSSTACTSNENQQKGVATTTRLQPQVEVQSESSFYFQFCPAQEN